MKQLVILSGKGGTGKTSVTAAFAHLASLEDFPIRAVLADADVDAANLELVLAPKIETTEDFRGGPVAEINPDLCAACDDCVQVCRFDAIFPPSHPQAASQEEESYWVDPIACDGCAACVYQCPAGAISMHDQVVGQWFQSQSRYGPLFHAALRPAQENSGRLVTLVKQRARLKAMDEGFDLVLVDGPPGIGCPVISAVSGADLALIVAESTVAGAHDMQRVLETVEHFGVQAQVCINKADLYPEGAAQIERFCAEKELPVIGRIPFDRTVTDAMVQGEPVTAFRPESPASQAMRAIWERVMAALMEKPS